MRGRYEDTGKRGEGGGREERGKLVRGQYEDTGKREVR